MLLSSIRCPDSGRLSGKTAGTSPGAIRKRKLLKYGGWTRASLIMAIACQSAVTSQFLSCCCCFQCLCSTLLPGFPFYHYRNQKPLRWFGIIFSTYYNTIIYNRQQYIYWTSCGKFCHFQDNSSKVSLSQIATCAQHRFWWANFYIQTRKYVKTTVLFWDNMCPPNWSWAHRGRAVTPLLDASWVWQNILKN